MADDEERKSESPTNAKEFKDNLAPRPKRKRKENVAPRRNPIRQVRITSKISGAGTSQSNDMELNSDDESILPPLKKQVVTNKGLVFIEKALEQTWKEEEFAEKERKIAELQARMDDFKSMVRALKKCPRLKFWQPPDPSKNCKHLTNDQISESFKKHMRGIIYKFDRELYKRRYVYLHDPCVLRQKMPDPASLLLFKYKQLKHMVRIMINKFDPEQDITMWMYFFQMLVPEFCIMIFMDIYNMTRDETMNYLNLKEERMY